MDLCLRIIWDVHVICSILVVLRLPSEKRLNIISISKYHPQESCLRQISLDSFFVKLLLHYYTPKGMLFLLKDTSLWLRCGFVITYTALCNLVNFCLQSKLGMSWGGKLKKSYLCNLVQSYQLYLKIEWSETYLAHGFHVIYCVLFGIVLLLL